MKDQMDCKSALDILQDYLEGLLEEPERARLEKHLNVCSSCKQEAMRYKELFSMLEDIEPVDAPSGFENTVINRLKKAGLLRRGPAKLRWIGLASEPVSRKLKYPVIAFLVLAALYLPFVVFLGGIREAGAKALVRLSGLLVDASLAIKEFDFIYRLFEILRKDLRVVETILNALVPFARHTGSDLAYAGMGILGLVILVLLYRNIRKRRFHNASCCF